jgi:hypothetical protein
MHIPFVAGVVGVAMCLTGVAACAVEDSATSAYCHDVRVATDQLRALDEPGGLSDRTFAQLMSRTHTIAGEAPADIVDPWAVLDTDLKDLDQALTGAGLTMDDLAIMQTGQPPPGMTHNQFQKYSQAAEKIDSAAVAAAVEKIRGDASSRCGVELGAPAA